MIKNLLRIISVSFLSVLFQLVLGFSVTGAQYAISPAKDDDKSNWSFNLTVEPGQTYKNEVVIYNLGKEAITLNLRGSDARSNSVGSIYYLKTSKNLGTWIKFESDSYVLQAGESKRVGFSVEVPLDATPGEYAGGVVASPVQERSEEVVVSGSTVQTVTGIKMFLTVPGEMRSKLSLKRFSFEKIKNEENKYNFITQIKNEGNTHLNVEAEIVINSIWGGSENIKVNLGNILAGNTSLPVIRWENDKIFDQGTAKIILKFKPVRLSESGNSSVQSQVVEEVINFRTYNPKKTATYLGACFGIAALIIIPIIIRRRKFRYFFIYQVVDGDTLDSISTIFGSNSADIIAMNQLPFPYTITTGQNLKIPVSKDSLEDIKNNPEKYGLQL